MRFLWKSAAACAVAAGAAFAFFSLPHGLDPIKEANMDLNDEALVEHGRYLTLAGDCAACHTTRAVSRLRGDWRSNCLLERFTPRISRRISTRA